MIENSHKRPRTFTVRHNHIDIWDTLRKKKKKKKDICDAICILTLSFYIIVHKSLTYALKLYQLVSNLDSKF